MNCLFQSLFNEFLELLKTKNLIESRFSRHYDGTWFVDFQYLLRQLDIFGKAEDLRKLPSFNAFFQLIADEKQVTLESAIKSNIYPVFGFQFSEYFNYIYSSGAKPVNFSNPHADISPVTDKAFIDAYLHKIQPAQENIHLIFFDNLEIEKDFIVNSELSFHKISDEFIKNKIQKYSEPDIGWSRVKTVIQFKGNFSSDEIVIKLSTLLRLFKVGEIRYKATYKKNIHWYKGDFYKSYKNSFSEADYVEYQTCKSAPMHYRIKGEDIDALISFLNINLSKMDVFLYSARVYNLLQSINVQLLVSVQFFVIESFFPHIEYQIKEKISEALMIILEEDIEFKNLIKKYYKIRSEIAHGDLQKANKRRNEIRNKEPLELILKRLWLKLLELDWNPKNSKELLDNLLKAS